MKALVTATLLALSITATTAATAAPNDGSYASRFFQQLQRDGN